MLTLYFGHTTEIIKPHHFTVILNSCQKSAPCTAKIFLFYFFLCTFVFLINLRGLGLLAIHGAKFGTNLLILDVFEHSFCEQWSIDGKSGVKVEICHPVNRVEIEIFIFCVTNIFTSSPATRGHFSNQWTLGQKL